MALADSSRAIGAVTSLLETRISAATLLDVSIGRPEPPANSNLPNPRFNLFLYEAAFDPHMKNIALDDGQEPPLWLVLRFLITPFDVNGSSDTAEAHRLLGQALRVLHSLGELPLNGATPPDPALADNPEPLKVTFKEASFDLLSKIMQGSDERYRFSMAFEVRPIMIASPAAPLYSLLIGIDYSAPAVIGDDGVQLALEPTLGPVLASATPAAFAAVPANPNGLFVELRGQDLHLSGLTVELGPVSLPGEYGAGVLRFQPDRALLNGGTISAGTHPLAVARTLPNGRRRRSNLLAASLLPEVTSASFTNRVVVSSPPGQPDQVTARIDLGGFLLGGPEDDVFVALYHQGETVAAFDNVVALPGPAQENARVDIPTPGVPALAYLVIVRVNGVQARQSLPLDLS